jgi:hypothetical protein
MTATSPPDHLSPAGIWRRVRDHFLLESSERQVRTRSPEQQEMVAKYHRAGVERSTAADDLSGASGIVSSMLLYREAARLFIAAAVTAHDAGANPRALLADADSPWEALANLLRQSAIPAPPAAVESCRKILTAKQDPLAFDEANPEDVVDQRTRVKEAVDWLRGLVEPRPLNRILGERRARVALLCAVAFVVLVLIPWGLSKSPNLALHRPVTASSRIAGSLAPEDNSGVVNGSIESKYGVHTNVGGGWVTVDLQAVHQISTVKVFNRADGWFDDGLPLRLELSEDGQQWKELERRTTSFSATDPWVAQADGARARFVRVASNNYVALTEIEIY